MNVVAGSLHRHLAWWREHVSNSYILDTIENGYRLPLLAVPEDTFLKNNKSALDNSQDSGLRTQDSGLRTQDNFIWSRFTQYRL